MDAKLEKIKQKLEKWYPEHKAFAMDAIDKTLRESCAKYASEHGKSVEELLKEIGFTIISGKEVYELRGPAKYSPGNEPDVIKSKVESILRRLHDAYPNKIINNSMQTNVKNLYKDISGAAQWLGYSSPTEFVQAYGYKFETENLTGGRPKSVDPQEIIKALHKKYPNGSDFTSADDLFEANPEYKGNLKTLKNISTETFGLSLTKYLLSIGLIKPKTTTTRSTTSKGAPRKKNYIICKVNLDTVKEPVYYLTTSKTLQEGQHVEVPYGIDDFLVYATVIESNVYDADATPCDVDETKTVSKKLGVKEYQAGLFGSILHTNAVYTTESLINKYGSHVYKPVNNAAGKYKDKAVWAICRGLATEVIKILDYLIEKDEQSYELKDLIMIEEGISELRVFGEDVEDVLENFPNVKMVMFAENKKDKKVNLYYSRIGADVVTDAYEIGNCDISSDTRWSLKHSPTDSKFEEEGIVYTFKYESDWLEVNYVYSDEEGTLYQLGK